MTEQLNLQITADTSGVATSVGSLKKQLREAQAEVASLSDKFGATSKEAINAAKRAAELKDAIGDAKALTEAFNPDAKFKALTASLSGVAGGFGAIQGAMALFGAESDNVQKTLLKVQSAMAISQGLQAVGESVDSFKQLGAVIQNSTLLQKANSAATAAAAAVQKLFTGAVTETATGFKILKGAIAATGIGLIIVALGTIVAYWDDIKASIGGVSSAQKQLNIDAEKNLAAEEKKLDALDNQTNQLKLQGKSEKEILQLKLAQTKQNIAAAKVSLLNAKTTKDAQVAASKRNQDILIGIMNFIQTPINKLFSAIDSIGTAFGKQFNLVKAFDATNKSLVNYLFDPKDTAEKGDATIEAAANKLQKLESDAAGYQLQINGINKKGNEANNKDAEDQARKQIEAQAVLNEANKKLKTQQEQELQTIEDSYAEKRKKLAEAGIKDNGDLAKAEQAEKDAVNEKYKKQELEKEASFQAELNKIKLDIKLAGIKDEYEKAKIQLEENYKKQYEDIEKNETRDAEEKLALKKALQQKEDAELDALKLVRDSKKAEEDIVLLDKEIAKAAYDLEFQKTLLSQKDILLEESYKKRLISEKTYTDGVDANTKARIEIDKAETESKMRNAEMASQLLKTVSDAIGTNTAVGKATAVAAATIDTYLSAQKAYTSQLIPGDPSSLIRAKIAAGIAVVGGIKNVKSILSVKTPGGSGGGASAPSMNNMATSAPMAPPAPQAQTTNISQQSINQMGNQAVRAYVIENDVTSNQQRVEAIKQRARFS
jgi:hypothetical protein